MVNHNNPNITRRFLELFNLKGEDAPTEVTDTILATKEIEPKQECFDVSNGTTGVTPIITTSAIKDFYITGLVFSFHADASADNTFVSVRAIINGLTKNIFYISKPTLTAMQINQTITFKHPIKVDRNSQIDFYNSFSAGTSACSVVLYGYYEPDN